MAAAELYVVSSLLSAFGSLSQSEAQAKQLQAEADAAKKNAQLTRAAGRLNAAFHQRNSEQAFGAMHANLGASGVSADSGSFLNVLSQSHTNAELDRLNILFQSELEASALENRAEAALKGMSNTRSAGYVSAAGALLGGAAKVYDAT